MGDACREAITDFLTKDLRHWTWFWANIQDRGSQFENVVDLARVDNANKGFPHNYQVQVRRGQ